MIFFRERYCEYNEHLPNNFTMMPLQSYMDSEIRAIMAQYMPLESQEMPNQHRPVEHADIWNNKAYMK